MSDLLPAKFSEMTRAIERMSTAEDGMKALAIADAMAAYAKRINASIETHNAVWVFRLRAERKFGKILKQMPKANGTRGQLSARVPKGKKLIGDTKTELPIPTYRELGIPPKVASRAQFLANMADRTFDEAIEVGIGTEFNGNRVFKDIKEKFQRDTRAKKRLQSASVQTIDSGIVVGDFREVAGKLADGSVSLIFTDPPYDIGASQMLPPLAEFAAAKLADGGSLLCYVGQTQIPAALDSFRLHLTYFWTIACVHAGRSTVMREYGIKAGWKAVLWFVKGTRDDNSVMVSDVMSGGQEKEHHDWQQSESEAAYWIKALCPTDGIVCDPFLGGGTTAAAAKALGRKWIGFEIDEETARVASGRLAK